MDEFELIQRYFTRSTDDDSVRQGVGDDGAVLRPEAGHDLVSVVDAMVADVHFPSTLAAADVGFRIVAVNLSDIAAMGAVPKWMLLSLTLPESDEAWLEAFSSGLFEASRDYAVTLVGGDTTRGSELVVSVHMLGSVPAEAALKRRGARPGDEVWITGSTGDAAAGLRLMARVPPGNADAEFLRRRFTRPDARVGFGTAIRGIASSAIDISDGLYADLGKLLRASSVGATLELDEIPISASLRHLFSGEALRLALTGGDDYELCFTVGADKARRLLRVAEESATPVTRIGVVTDVPGISCRSGNDIVSFDDSGFRHFGEV